MTFCRIITSHNSSCDVNFKPQIISLCLWTWESILICMTILASVFINKINSIHFIWDKPLLHCFSSGLLNVIKRDTSNLELSPGKTYRLSCACFSIKKACHVLLELEGMPEVNCLLSNLKQESPLLYPQERARRAGIDSAWETAVVSRQNSKGLSCDVLFRKRLGIKWTTKFDWNTAKVPSKIL